ncbi:MAG: Mur ligase family protein [Filifactoraceae bacterium]
MKNIKEYINILKEAHLITDYSIGNYEITQISMDSREVINGSLFICKGMHFSPSYLRVAKEKQAFCYISEKKYKEENMDYIIVKDIRVAMGILADFHYDSAWKNLTTIGITGTKGKSTTAYMLKTILDIYEEKNKSKATGIISSIETYDGKQHFESHITTPEALELHKHFHNAVESNLKFVTMEVSSQALKYNRVDKIELNYGGFLNIGYDHVSPVEHKDFNDYFESKLRIFNQCHTAVVNLDSDNIDTILERAKTSKKLITFGFGKGDYSATEIKKEEGFTIFQLKSEKLNKKFRLSMPGFFNVSNALCAIAIADDLGVDEESIEKGLETTIAYGRMELYSSKDNRVLLLIDYAHNKLSFETLFSAIKYEYPDRKIVSVFGCPGGKALDRRRDLGLIAGEYAYRVIITEEDYGEEDLLKISQEIEVNVKEKNRNCEIILDREEAIKEAINTEGQLIVLLTGKGRETRQKRGTSYVECRSDFEIALELLEIENQKIE